MSDRHRKSLVYAALVLSAAVVAGTAAAAPETAPPPAPTAGCSTFSDPADDATPFNFGAPFPAGPSDPDLDITSVVLASPPGKLRAYLKVAKLGTPAYALGHTFSISFLHNGKRVKIYGGEDEEPVGAVHTAAAGGGAFVQPLTGVTYDAAPVAGAVVDAVFDTKASTVVLTTDRAPIEKVATAALADGVKVTEVLAESAYDQVVSTTLGDTAKTADYTVGDNACFAPPKSKLTLTAPARAVAGHAVVISGSLTDLAGKAGATRTVGIAIGRTKVTTTTSTTGAFRQVVPLELSAGSYAVTATWAGDASLAAGSVTRRMTVTKQPTRATLTAAPAGASTLLTVLLVDDLRRPLAGKPVTWSVGGKVVRTSRTDAKGRSTFSAAPGSGVRVAYAGDARYAPSTASRTA